MIIKTTKSFDKQYAKLDPGRKQQFKKRLTLFVASPFDPTLRNHALKGKYIGYRSIDIAGDLRALYVVKGDTIIVFAL